MTWYLVLIIIAIVNTFSSGSEPNWIVPVAALSIEGILQILYSIGYGASRKLMYCWYAEYPSYGYCTWTWEEPEDDPDEPLFEVVINLT